VTAPPIIGPTPELRPVTRELFEQRLEEVLAAAPSPRIGLFGPDSVVWKVTRFTPVYLLSTPLSGIMHAAHPWIAQGVKEHSKLFEDPRLRARGTYTFLMRIVFGDVDTVRRTSRALHSMHSRVEGTVPDGAGRFGPGSAYSANEVEALPWVHLVFFWSRLRMYQRVVGALTTDELERYTQESNRFAACFGIPADALPQSYAELEATVEGIAASDAIATTAAGRETVAFLLGQLPGPARAVFIGFLVETMPESLRVALELPGPSRRTRTWNRLVLTGLRLLRRTGPAGLRYVPAYLEARERVQGVPQPRLSRRFNKALLGRESTLG